MPDNPHLLSLSGHSQQVSHIPPHRAGSLSSEAGFTARLAANCNISRGFGLLISIYAAQKWNGSRAIKHPGLGSELHSQS